MAIDHRVPYDDQNIFAKLLRGDIPAERIAESDHAIAFRDINPLAPTHVLVIPRGDYVSWEDFAASASDAEIADLVRLAGKIGAQCGGETGFRVLANAGQDAGQEVPHFHIHVFAGKPLGPMLTR